MSTADQPVLRRQIVWAFYWLIGTLGFLFLAGCFLDVGIVLALPLIGLVSAVAWLALAVEGIRAARAAEASSCAAAATALASVVAVATAWVALGPVMRASGFVQAFGIMVQHADEYARDVRQASIKGWPAKPLTWSYGGWLSTDRLIVFWPTGNPDRLLMAESGNGSFASCRWLRSSYYDCTVSY